MKFISDNRGTAYGIVLVVCIFLLVSIIYVVASPALNQVFQIFNSELIETGIASERTKDTLEFQRMMWNSLPWFFGLLLLLLYPLVIALREKRGET